jgi:hypothetical protein
MKSNQDNVASIANLSFNSMTQTELRNLAKQTGTKVGKSKSNTIVNLTDAVIAGKIQFKSTFVVAPVSGGLLPNQPVASNALFQKKFRNYNGFDKVEFVKS